MKGMQVEKGYMIPTMQFGPDDVFLYEDWEESPVGPYRALFHYSPEDFRTLYAQPEAGMEFVSTVHRFDRKVPSRIRTTWEAGRLRVEVRSDEARYDLEVEFRETPLLKLLNPLVSMAPAFLSLNPLFQKAAPRLLAPLLGTDPRQRMGGVTEMGRTTVFRIRRVWLVTGGSCSCGGRDLGDLTECHYEHDMGDFRPISRAMMTKLDLLVS
jgi:hypothetical protein